MNAKRCLLAAGAATLVAAAGAPAATAKPVTKTIPATLEFPHGARGDGCYARAHLHFAHTANGVRVTAHYFKAGLPITKTEDDVESLVDVKGFDTFELDYQEPSGHSPGDCSDISQAQMATFTGPATVDVTYDPNPTPYCNGTKATIVAKPGRKTVGTSRRDVIYGTPKADKIDGRGGNDLICSGDGNDTILGGAGNDELHGFPGNDTLSGGAGKDYLAGGLGRDRLLGGAGNDDVAGGLDADTLFGQAGNDLVIGGPENDKLFGGAGNDDLRGGEGKDKLDGGSGKNKLQQ